ncbi:MAG: LCP family protein [Termitinemataceae bacterium]|nr:MAG: LCP family protein [Termitinemataceae bacterium]
MIKKNVDFSFLLLTAIAFIILGSVFFLVWTVTKDPIEADLIEDRVITSLFIIENKGEPIGTYLALLYPPSKRFAVFEVSGDVGLILDQINRVDRIDSVYKSGKINPYVHEIEKLLSLTIKYTVVFTLDNLANTTDILQGVTVFIPSPIEYFESESSVLLPSGIVNLDGEKLKEYLTFYNEDYEIEKLSMRNQRFFTGFIKRIAEQKDYLNNPLISNTFTSFIDGNMNKKTLKRFFNELSAVDTDRLSITSIGGTYRNVSGKTLLIPYNDGSLIKEIVSQTLTSITRKTNTPDGDRIWTVEVLNGTLTPGLANRTAELIRGFGYDIINLGNADKNNYDKTEIINRTDSKSAIEKFSEIITCTNIVNDTSALDISDYEYKADFTLILGRDFDGRHTQN